MNETTDATSILLPLWRRKWLILTVGVVVAAASYFYYKHATRVYQSTTQIYLGASLEEQAPGEKTSSKGQTANVANQVAIINSIVIEQVRQQLRQKDKALIRGSKVRAKSPEKSEFIAITAEAHTAKGAALLANTTARTFIRRQHASRQLRRIEAASVPKAVPKTAGKSKNAPAVTRTPSTSSVLQAAALNSKINQLEASLGVAGAEQIKPAKATTALLLSPKPRKNAIFGFVLGIVLAAIAAYAVSYTHLRAHETDS